jgi:hypothetical protein
VSEVIFGSLIVMKELFRVNGIKSQNILIGKVVRVLISDGVQKNTSANEKGDCAHNNNEGAPVVFDKVEFISA